MKLLILLALSVATVFASCTAPLVPFLGQYMFVTSTVHSGNMGGISGADAICQARADATSFMGSPRQWKAWLSTSTSSPASTFITSPLDYARPDGVIVASGWNQLVSGTLSNTPSLTELCTAVPSNLATGEVGMSGRIRTGTKQDGTAVWSTALCGDWTTTSFTGTNNIPYGDPASLYVWSQNVAASPERENCTSLSAIYCVSLPL